MAGVKCCIHDVKLSKKKKQKIHSSAYAQTSRGHSELTPLLMYDLVQNFAFWIKSLNFSWLYLWIMVTNLL